MHTLLECHFTFPSGLQKSCTGKETALIATQHENDRLKKEIEQLSGRNAQLDFQLRQVQVLVCILYTVGWEIFTVKIIRGLNFCVKNICRSWFCYNIQQQSFTHTCSYPHLLRSLLRARIKFALPQRDLRSYIMIMYKFCFL